MAKYGHPKSPFAPMPTGGTYTENEETLEAVVLDIIVNEDHPEYGKKDGYNVGTIKFRLLKGQFGRPDSTLHWAFPIDITIEEFPLKNEIVRIFTSLNRFYYTRKINVGYKPTHQAIFGLNTEAQPTTGTKDTVQARNSTKGSPLKATETDPADALGDYFTDTDIWKLRHWEGDAIIEGRSGHSIRFGSSWTDPKINKGIFPATVKDQAANILIRIGPDPSAIREPKDSNYGRVTEDINKDASSVWMVEDQTIALEYATKDNADIHKKDIRNFPSSLDGNQIVINTDRFVVNTKKDKIMLFSFNGIHNTTLQDFSVDAANDYLSYIGQDRAIEIIRDNIQNIGRNYQFWIGTSKTVRIQKDNFEYTNGITELHSGTRISLIGKQVFVGSPQDTSEPIALGETLRQLLLAFANAHLNNASEHVITFAGPGVLNPAIITALTQIVSQLESKTILSNDNFVSKKNSTPTKAGNRTPIEPR